MSDTVPDTEPEPAAASTDVGEQPRKRVAPFDRPLLAVAIGDGRPVRRARVGRCVERRGGQFGAHRQARAGDGRRRAGRRHVRSLAPKGSWVVLNFFDPAVRAVRRGASRARHLRREQAAIADGAELYTIISRQISPRGDDVSDVLAFFEEQGGDWPIVEDPTGGISVVYGVLQVPETWVVDPNGIVRRRFAGTITADGLSSLLQAMRDGVA